MAVVPAATKQRPQNGSSPNSNKSSDHKMAAVQAVTKAATTKWQQSQQYQKQRPQNGSSPNSNKSSDHKMAAVPTVTKAATTKWQ